MLLIRVVVEGNIYITSHILFKIFIKHIGVFQFTDS